MKRDKLWNEIRKGLNDKLDPELFERCVQDLLRDAYPGLVPVVGGGDAGMDGAIAAQGQEPLPLICTTSTDVIGNFRKSISNHLRKRGGPSHCVLVTSQRLTPKRRDNILSAARASNIQIRQIHEQEDLIGRLYAAPHWRKELLGIGGAPPALAIFPPHARIWNSGVLIGRESDLEWIRNTHGDVLIVGQPGSGKTYLHQYLAQSGEAVFMVAADPERLADAIRETSPSRIVVDDAHIRLDWIDLLKQIRLATGLSFSIHANCWPGSETGVRDRLEITPGSLRHLDLLPQNVILELIKSLGIGGPDELLQLLIEQSDGKPGLTAALVDICRSRGIQHVWSGEGLADMLIKNRRISKDETDEIILATFALGGDAGMDSGEVSRILNISPLLLQERLSKLASGGVVSDLGNYRLSVRPPAVRAILVRDHFFRGQVPFNWQEMVLKSPTPQEAIGVLLSARQRGADVPLDYLELRVQSINDKELWEHFAWVDPQCASIVLEKYPSQILHCAAGLLHNYCEETLRRLLRIDDAEVVNKLQEWMFPWDEVALTILRRTTLLKVVEEELDLLTPAEHSIVSKCLKMIVSPAIHGHARQPGNPLGFQYRRGVLGEAELSEIAKLWPRILELLPKLPTKFMQTVVGGVDKWVYPNIEVEEKHFDILRKTATHMLRDVLSLPNCTPALKLKIATTVRRASLDLHVKTESPLNILFKETDYKIDWQVAHENRCAELNQLANEWMPLGLHAVADKLGQIEKDAAEVEGMPGGETRSVFYGILAERADQPDEWLEHFMQKGLPSRLLWPFFIEVKMRQPHLLEALLPRWLEHPEFSRIAIGIVFQIEGISSEIWNNALRVLENDDCDQFHYYRAELPIDNVRRLLKHPVGKVAQIAVHAEWERTEDHSIRPELLADWTDAVSGVDTRSFHWLGDVFIAYPCTAFEWAKRQIITCKNLWSMDGQFTPIGKILDLEQRRELIMLMNSRAQFDTDCFHALLRDDFEIYRDWYRRNEKMLRFEPFDRKWDSRSEALALIAFEEGASPDEIRKCVVPTCWTIGEAQSCVDTFQELCANKDPRFQVIGQAGLKWAQRELEDERRRENHEAIYGR